VVLQRTGFKPARVRWTIPLRTRSTQIGRILAINDLHVIADDVVEAARSTLGIGAT
jgi:hypothetical protein